MNKEILKASQRLASDTITLPVVVHIINPNPAAISDAQIINGIIDLNNAFSKSGPYAASAGVDTKIRFCIAKKDPEGGVTNGITRTTSYFGTNLSYHNEDNRLKNLIQWDPTRYINIWLVTSINGEGYASYSCGIWTRLGVGGYATMPPGGGPLDGIVITTFGSLLAHEMGHYLGLYHTFQGGCNNYDCQLTGDLVCDTPPDRSVFSVANCNLPNNSCNTDTLSNYSNGNFFTDVPDQIRNFMDYGNVVCRNQFTQGQTDRMRAAILTQRSGLLQDQCTPPCADNVLAGFTRNNPYPLPGDNLTFSNNSTGASAYEWLVDGTVVSTSLNFSYTFNTIGKYKVTLKAYSTATCFSSYTDYIIVTCGVAARFYVNKQLIASNATYPDSIIFTNNSYNAVSYQWLIGNDQGMAEQVVSTNTHLTYVFNTPANYTVRLIATNGSCSDTSNVFTARVVDPNPDGAPFNFTITCYQQNKVRASFCIANFGFAPIPANTPVNFYDANPSLPTANKLSPTFYTPYSLAGGNCGYCFTHILDVPYRGLEKIYIVFNDAGLTVPVVLPNTPLVEKLYINNIAETIPIKTVVNITICQGQSYAGYNSSGTYIDTLVSILTGCDSIRTLHLTVKPVFFTTITATICQGQTYEGYGSSGVYSDVFIASNGCDSTRTLNLTVNPVFNTVVSATICDGENYAGHTTSGTYVDIYTASNGCDSTRTLHLTVLPNVSTTISRSICNGENFEGYSVSGTYTDVFTAANGCDSTRILHLTVQPTFNTTITTEICDGESYAGHTSTGTYVDVYTAMNGCDSTRTLHLTVKPLTVSTINMSICEGENYAGYASTGTYVDVFTGANGCDSTRTLHLIVKPIIRTSLSAVICEGENYAGHVATGTYVDTYPAANGCDSIRTLQLLVNPRVYTTISAAICDGESYLAGGVYQTNTGIYRDTLRSYLGCDSVITTNLTVNPLPVPDLGPDRGLCANEFLILNPGAFTTYQWHDGSTNPVFNTNQIGTYSVSVTNSFGCRAADTMQLRTIYPVPANFLPADSSLCQGNVLRVRTPGFIHYNWSTGSSESFIDVTLAGTYHLQATDRNGCIGVDSISVFFYQNCISIQVPSAFTPNGDGLNDVFRPLIPAPLNDYRMQIWNRQGKMLFETKEIGKGWNGNFNSVEQPAAVYVFLITYKDTDGREIRKSGTLLLVR